MAWTGYDALCCFGGSKSPKPMQVVAAPTDDSAQRAAVERKAREEQAMAAGAGRRSTIFAGAKLDTSGMQRRVAKKQRPDDEDSSVEM